MTPWTLESITKAVGALGRCWGTRNQRSRSRPHARPLKCVLPKRHAGRCMWRLPKPSVELTEFPF